MIGGSKGHLIIFKSLFCPKFLGIEQRERKKIIWRDVRFYQQEVRFRNEPPKWFFRP